MNYLKPELLEQLAAEYVLGTMQGAARRRFERLMMESYRARSAVWSWEQHINPLAGTISPQSPRKRVWKQIQQRIRPQQQNSAATFWWRGWSAISAVLVVVMALYIVQWQPWQSQVPGAAQVAMFNDDDAQPLWLISTSASGGRLMVKPINAQAVAVDNRAFELWMLPTGSQPVSLGLMPVSGGAVETVLSPQLLTLLQDTPALAVSLEPVGGSPTGQPTGPVVYQAPFLQF